MPGDILKQRPDDKPAAYKRYGKARANYQGVATVHPRPVFIQVIAERAHHGRDGKVERELGHRALIGAEQQRLDGAVVESVNDLAQVEQIVEPAEIVATTSIVRLRSPCLLGVPIGPIGRNQRAATVWQDHENEEDAAPPDAADHGQRLAFEGVALAGDGQRIWNITVMGSLWPLPSTALTTTGCCGCTKGSATSTGGWLRCCAGTTPTSASLAIASASVASVFRS